MAEGRRPKERGAGGGRRHATRRPRAVLLLSALGGLITFAYSVYLAGAGWALLEYCNPPPPTRLCLASTPFGLSPGGVVAASLLGLFAGGVIVALGALAYGRPHRHVGVGVLLILVSLLTIPAVFGAVFGFLLTLVAGILALSFDPDPTAAPPRFAGGSPFDSGRPSAPHPYRAGWLEGHGSTPVPSRAPAAPAAPPRPATGPASSPVGPPGAAPPGAEPQAAGSEAGSAVHETRRRTPRTPPPSWAREHDVASSSVPAGRPSSAPGEPPIGEAYTGGSGWTCGRCGTVNTPWAGGCVRCGAPSGAAGAAPG